VFLPQAWLGRVRELSIGTFEDWCGARLSDHVPVVVEVDAAPAVAPVRAEAFEQVGAAPHPATAKLALAR
jgi:hypothetical protein